MSKARQILEDLYSEQEIGYASPEQIAFINKLKTDKAFVFVFDYKTKNGDTKEGHRKVFGSDEDDAKISFEKQMKNDNIDFKFKKILKK